MAGEQVGSIFVAAGIDLQNFRQVLREQIPRESLAGGEKAASEILKGMRAEFNKGIGQAREALANNLIDKKQFSKINNELKKEFNTGILAAIEELRRKTPEATDEINKLQRALKSVSTTGTSAGRTAGQGIRKGFLEQVAGLPTLIRGSLAAGVIASFTYIANKVVDVFRSMVSGIKAVIDRGGLVQQIRDSFDALASSRGLSATKALEELRRGSRGLATDLDLIRQSNLALQAGLPVTEESLGRLVAVSRGLARTVGRDATESYERLIGAIAKGEKELLDEFGIILNFNAVYKDYAKNVLGVSRELTEQEKATARLNAVLAQGEQKIAAVGKETLTAGERIQQASVFVRNLRDALAEAVVESPKIAELLDTIGDSAENAGNKVEDLADKFGAFIDTIIAKGAPFATAAKNIAGFFGKALGFDIQADFLGGFLGPTYDEFLARRRAERERQRRDQEARAATARLNARATAGTTGGAPDPAEAKRIASEIKTIEEGLIEDVLRLTESAADAQIRRLDELEARYRKLKGSVTGEYREAFKALREAAQQMRSLEGYEDQLKVLQGLPTPGAADAPERLASLRTFLDGLQQQEQFVQDNADARERLNGLIEQTEKLMLDVAAAAKKEGEEQKKSEEESLRAHEERIRALRDEARQLEEYARSAVQVAEAIGLIGKETADALEDVAQLGAGLARVLGGDSSAIPSVIGSVASLASKVFGKDSEAERRHRENLNALEKIRLEIAGFRLTGDFLQRAQRAAEISQEFQPLLGRGGGAQKVGGRLTVQAFASQGISFAELKALADELNIELFDEKGRITAEGLDALNEALGLAVDQLTGFGRSLEDRRTELELEADIFDLDDSSGARLQRERQLLQEYGSEQIQRILAESKNSEEAVRELFRQFQAGTLDLGSLTREDFLDLLQSIEGLLDQGAETGGDGGASEGFTQVRSITEASSGRLLGALSTISYWVEQGARAAHALLSEFTGQRSSLPPPVIGGGSVDPTNGGARGDIWNITFDDINVTLPVTGSIDRSNARDVGSLIGDAAGAALVDRLSYERDRQVKRALGDGVA